MFVKIQIMRYYLFLAMILSIASCTDTEHVDTEGNSEGTLFRLVDTTTSNVDFINSVSDQENFNVLTYRNYYNGGGVALGDINNDGLADIYFTANMAPNRLYLNKGDFTFEDITDQAGVSGQMSWSTGVTFVDINGDGLLDIYVCNSGDVSGNEKRNELFINNGDLSFTESAAQYGIDSDGFSTHASFFDYDGDGDLDMYLLNNSFKDPSRINFKNIRNERDEFGGDKLYRNEGGKFIDVSDQANIYGSKIGFGLGVSVSDINNDDLPDIYISNDFWERDYLYLNQGDGTFSEELTDRIPFTSTASMGADIADINNDGAYEIFSTDMLPATTERLRANTIYNDYKLEDLKYRTDYHYQYTQNCLQLNQGDGHFKEVANALGLAATDWSWAALMFDFDNDGLKDIFVSNGVFHDITDMDFSDFLEDKDEVKKIVEEKGRFDFRDFLPLLPSTALPNYAFVNGGDLNFKNQAQALGLAKPSFSNGSAYGDLDNDGDLDLVVNNVNMPAFVYENTGSSNAYIRIKFDGAGLNPFGIGAKVSVQAGGQLISGQNYQARGFQSSTEPILTLGLGDAAIIDHIEITWPSGRKQQLKNVDINQTLTVLESDAGSNTKSQGSQSEVAPMLAAVQGMITAEHEENLFNDFDQESLMLHMRSQEGPDLLSGDLDGDGLDDVVLLGSAESPDKVFLQNSGGKFIRKAQPALDNDKDYEGVTGLLYDLDNDRDLDLIIGVGGNEVSRGIAYYKVRSYLNDGTGLFETNESMVLPIAGNLSGIIDLELDDRRAIFASSLGVPGNYGLVSRNFLLVEEQAGIWKDITTQEIGQIGMITDMTKADIDGDGDQDVLVAGEWMGIHVLKNSGPTLTNGGAMAQSTGLWQSITTADVDNDGDLDVIAGNWGNNSKFRSSSDQPLQLYVGDYDDNSKAEGLLLWTAPEDEESRLFAAKRDLTGQLPHLKKKILKNHQYAESHLADLLSQDDLKKGYKLQAEELRSAIFINEGGDNFTKHYLPEPAQWSSIHTIESLDINEDGFSDLIVGGNLYGLKPEVGRLDSSEGLVLINNQDGTFKPLNRSESGLVVKGQIRDIKVIKRANHSDVIFFGVNDAPVVVYEKQPAK